MMAFSMRAGIVTMKMWRIDTGKYVHKCRLLRMENKKIVIAFCCVFLQILLDGARDV